MTMEIAGDRPPRYGTIETGRSLLQGRRWLGIRPQSRYAFDNSAEMCYIQYQRRHHYF